MGQWQNKVYKPYLKTTENDAIELLDTVWNDLRFPGSAQRVGASTRLPTWSKFLDNGSGSQGVWAYYFDPSVENEMFFTAQLSHQWKQETSLHAHVHWSPTTTNTGTVIWGLEYSMQEINGTYGNTNIIYATDNADGTAKTHLLVDWADITMTGVTSVSAMLLGRVFRDAGSDTYADDAALLEFDIHYEIDSLGSRDEYTK
jgi:hypothetical protein